MCRTMKILKILPLILLLLAPLQSAPPSFAPPMDDPEIVVHNRILVKVQEKTISVVDLMKKMDVYIARNYPQHMKSPVARYQFYTAHWKGMLDQMINTELMLADAEQREVKVTEAEVRETLMQRFGPNVMATIERIGISYEEAWAMIHDDMVVQRMTWLRVHSKALQNVNSRDIKAAYEAYLKENPAKEEWKYQVLTIRSHDPKAGEALANRATSLIPIQKGLSLVAKELNPEKNSGVGIHVTNELNVSDKDLSSSHREILKSLKEGEFSRAIAQTSRADKSIVYRIFHLLEHKKEKPPTFRQMANRLQDELLEKEAAAQTELYIKKLYSRFNFNPDFLKETIPADFAPFTLE